MAKRSRAMHGVVACVALGFTLVAPAMADQKPSGDAAQAMDVDGTTPLHWAVYRNDVEAVKRLIKAGADVNASNDYGAMPLTEAAVAGNVEVIRRLLDAGADVNAANADGQTALMIIARSANVAAAKLLIARGADRQHNLATALSIDLHRNHYLIDGQQGFLGFRPWGVGHQAVAAKRLPTALGEVRHHRRQQLHQKAHGLRQSRPARRRFRLLLQILGDAVRKLVELRDGAVEAQALDVFGDLARAPMRLSSQFKRHLVAIIMNAF